MGVDADAYPLFGFPFSGYLNEEKMDLKALVDLCEDPDNSFNKSSLIRRRDNNGEDPEYPHGFELSDILRDTTFGGCGIRSYDGHHFIFAAAASSLDVMHQRWQKLDLPEVTADHEKALSWFCQAIGVEYQDPRWYLWGEIS